MKKNIFILFILITVGCSKNQFHIELIHNKNFISGSTEDLPDINSYICAECEFEISYNRNNKLWKDFINIDGFNFPLNELLVQDRIKFYRITNLNENYILVSSPDFSTSGKSYTDYLNFYLFKIDKNKVSLIKKDVGVKNITPKIYFYNNFPSSPKTSLKSKRS